MSRILAGIEQTDGLIGDLKLGRGSDYEKAKITLIALGISYSTSDISLNLVFFDVFSITYSYGSHYL